ncbi:MAG: ATP phosphoribosyltransferase regulatory subunit [Syntrophomonadaceae bacterium]|jgi:ATP phosphoribosyltransferase regulatory subunit|nr:ATP phosphoribosyltransferase regulatory subunit [Syntrophomonadaceae bacterium]MDH7498195.1 ATP phosphoribosyltransferase regulatory subunit [Syntrophomonadaceae bacterium]
MMKQRIPRGFKDFLPEEVALKREVERRAAELFASWGYREVITPVIEYLDVIEGLGTGVQPTDLFLFQNRDGRLVALRPDMTVPIARLASSKLRDEPLPLRLFYQANVFRHNVPQRGRYSEYWQVGVEMLGARGERADAEVIALAVETMQCLGLQDFQLSLNHINIFGSLLETTGLPQETKDEVRDLVIRKDLVGLEHKLRGLALPPALQGLLLRLPVSYGGLEVFDRLPGLQAIEGAAMAVDELRVLVDALRAFGVADRVTIDLGVLRGLDYYTGVVFEGYCPALGYPLLGGGRYDRVMEGFGWPNPATGFAVGVERVMLAIRNGGGPERPRCLVAGAELGRVMETARQLRARGWIVCLDVLSRPQAELEEECRRRGCRLVTVE